MNRRHPEPEGEWREQCIGRGVIRYLVAGEGEPVVLIHGLSGSVRWWRHNIPALARHYRVYALDLLEYHPDVARLQFILSEAARRIALWIRTLGLESASFIGHSMGGAIAAEIAADTPELLQKLVLVDAAAVFPRSRVPLSIPQLVRKAPHFSPTLVPVLIQDAWRTGPRILWGAARDLVTSDLRPKLAQIRAETLIIWGQHDGILPLRLADELRQFLPHSHMKVLARAGHNPMWEQPVEFNETVIRFLGKGI